MVRDELMAGLLHGHKREDFLKVVEQGLVSAVWKEQMQCLTTDGLWDIFVTLEEEFAAAWRARQHALVHRLMGIGVISAGVFTMTRIVGLETCWDQSSGKDMLLGVFMCIMAAAAASLVGKEVARFLSPPVLILKHMWAPNRMVLAGAQAFLYLIIQVSRPSAATSTGRR